MRRVLKVTALTGRSGPVRGGCCPSSNSLSLGQYLRECEQLSPKSHEADANWLRHPETPNGDSGDNLDRLSFVPHLGI